MRINQSIIHWYKLHKAQVIHIVIAMARALSTTMLNKSNRVVIIALYFFKRYPFQTFAIFASMFLAGISEGLGIMTLVVVVQVLLGEESQDSSPAVDFLFDQLQVLGISPTIGPVLLLFLGFIVIRTALMIAAQIYITLIGTRVEADFRYDLIDLVMRTKWRFFVSIPLGRFSNALNQETGIAAGAYGQICRAMSLVFNMVVYVAAAALLSWQLALGAIVTAVVMTRLMMVFVGISRKAGRQQATLYKSMVSRFSDGLQGIKTLKAMGLENVLTPLLKMEVKDLTGAQIRMNVAKILLRNIREPFIALVITVGMIVAISYWTMAIPVLVGMVILFNRSVNSAGQLQGCYAGLVSREGFYFSLTKLMDKARSNQEVIIQAESQPPVGQNVIFEKVSFSYGNSIPMLKEVSMSINFGQITALIGTSGSGKTTIADLICGLVLPVSGQIKIGQSLLSELNLLDWRAQIGYIQQEPVLFHDTILQNITLGVDTISSNQVEEALANAGALEFINNLPNGLDTNIGERGTRLSGGQRQRLTIARALVRNPSILIFDESTSALDPETELGIIATLRKLRENLAILFVSHQPAIVEVADRVYHLKDGMIEEGK